MELSLLLMGQILELFLIMLAGFFIVRFHILKDSDSRIVSLIVLYLVIPCAILESFSIEYTKETLLGLALAAAAAVVTQILFIIITALLSRIFSFDGIEQATLIYPNCGNLIIPLVGAVLGDEWVIYSFGYMATQTVLMWTHCINLISGRRDYKLKNIFLNVGVISILAGICLFIFQISLPDPLMSVIGKLGDMMGPLSMLVIGMLIGGMNLKEVFTKPKIYLITGLRLLVLPLIAVLLLKISGAARLLPDAEQILLITVMAACAPAAANVTQFAQLYNKDSAYAGMLNVVTVIFSIVTMPFIIAVYQIF